ncbi:phosphoribosylanthranilate isomerase [Bacteroidota bacterium]
MSNKPSIKICCIASVEEANLAIEYGASALGLVSSMPSGPGVIQEERIKQIADAVPSNIATFLLTSEQDSAKIIEQHGRCGTTTIQIVDKLKSGTHSELKAALPCIKIVQVIHVTNEDSIKEAVNIAPFVDAILLDSGNQSLTVKELGGTGRTHNWDISKKIVSTVNVPVYLAGGINPNNIREAFEIVRPYGIDLCSGVRTDGKLDERKLSALFSKIN